MKKVKNGLIATVILAVAGFVFARLMVLLAEGISGKKFA